MVLHFELAAARAIAALSRLVGAGGGTTLPGKLLWKLHPASIDALAAQLPQGSVVVSATNGKTTATAMAAHILGRGHRLAHNAAGANLVSGVASALLAAPGADLGLFEADEAALPEIVHRVRPRAVLLGNLFRDQLDRYGELELVAAGWRTALVNGGDAVLVANVDDPLLGELARAYDGPVRTFGLDDRTHARPSLQHAADSKYCLACGRPYLYAAAYVGHLGEWRCGGCGRSRLSLDVAARQIELRGLDGSTFTLASPEGTARVRLRLPGLYNVYNAVAAAALAGALGVETDVIAEGLESFTSAFGRFERIAVGDRGVLLLLVKNPAGGNEAVRTLLEAGTRGVAVVALNDEIADGRDVSWIWDVDFEPLLASLDRVIATGSRAAELALRFAYGGLDRSRIELVPDLEQALDRGLAETPPGGELVVLPTYTAMLGLRGIIAGRGHVAEYWERAA